MERLCERCSKETKVVTITSNGLSDYADSKKYPNNHKWENPYHWKVCEKCADELHVEQNKKTNWKRKEQEIRETYEKEIEQLKKTKYVNLFGRLFIKI